jgi:hypothetical protein
MREELDLVRVLAPWPAASERVESEWAEDCLTAEEISDFVDGTLPPGARERVATHLSQCSYCAREVGALYRAARDFDDRVRVRGALGAVTDRVGACVRVFVEGARGAYTRADAALQGLAAATRVQAVMPTPGYAFGFARGDEDAENEEDAADDYHEVSLHAEGLPGVELLCGEEDDGGSITVSLEEPWEVRLVAPDGSWQALEVEPGGDRYYATLTAMPPGEYLLTILRPEPSPPSPPSA